MRRFPPIALVLALGVSSWTPASGAAERLLLPAPRLPVSVRPAPGATQDRALAAPPGGGLVVDRWSRPAVVDFWNTWYQPAFLPVIGWTGSVPGCVPGLTSAAHADATIQLVNWFRAMAGLSGDVARSAGHDTQVQSAALVMIANGNLSHTPPAGWACWSPVAYDGAYNSNLALGIEGPSAVNGYIDDDGAGNEEVGHRRWILYPAQQSMGTGSTDGVFQAGPFVQYVGSNALWVFDPFGTPPSTPLVVTWPPAGFVPFPVVFARWSISIAGADFRQASVVVTRGGSPLAITVHPQTPIPGSGYWVGDETLVIELAPADLAFAPGMPDTTYRVSITGIVGINGAPVPASATYDVTVIDPNAAGPPDTDADGVPDASDNCRWAANLDQADRGGVGSLVASDGIGDACQCGDVSGDGKVTVADAVLIQRSKLIPPTATLVQPQLCDVGGSLGCSTGDAVILRRSLLSPPTAQIQPACTPAHP